MIHAKHYLEDENKYEENIRTMSFELWDIYETSERAASLRPNLEEQRTVIGPDIILQK